MHCSANMFSNNQKKGRVEVFAKGESQSKQEIASIVHLNGAPTAYSQQCHQKQNEGFS